MIQEQNNINIFLIGFNNFLNWIYFILYKKWFSQKKLKIKKDQI